MLWKKKEKKRSIPLTNEVRLFDTFVCLEKKSRNGSKCLKWNWTNNQSGRWMQNGSICFFIQILTLTIGVGCNDIKLYSELK